MVNFTFSRMCLHVVRYIAANELVQTITSTSGAK